MIEESVKNRYEIVVICVALGLGYDAIQHNEEMSSDSGERLLLMMWEILTQYSKFVLHTVGEIVVLIPSHLPLLFSKKFLVLTRVSCTLWLLSCLNTSSPTAQSRLPWRPIAHS